MQNGRGRWLHLSADGQNGVERKKERKRTDMANNNYKTQLGKTFRSEARKQKQGDRKSLGNNFKRIFWEIFLFSR